MPNGDPNWAETEYPKLEAFFGQIASVLVGFAQRHGLEIDKYYHQTPEWDFRFKHPLGGGGAVSVRRVSDTEVAIMGSWYVDDYDKFTRFIKWSEQKECSLDSTEIAKLLSDALKEVVAWRLGQWTQVATGYQNPWGNYSKEEWERIYAVKYPLPKLDEL